MSERRIKVACIQLRSGDDVSENIAMASKLIRAAHKDGARFIATPENTTLMAADGGATVIPVWNKSNREHAIVGSEPASVRAAADAAVQQLGWSLPYHVDADHINLNTVDRFIAASDFYTLDVASAIGQPAATAHAATSIPTAEARRDRAFISSSTPSS